MLPDLSYPVGWILYIARFGCYTVCMPQPPASPSVRARFRLRELLDQHKPEPLTQADLSRRSGVGSTTINRMAANKTRQVSLGTLEKLSAVLGCEPSDLIEREPTKGRRGAK
jgi:DNA-binding Xre family transcriptional regulator